MSKAKVPQILSISEQLKFYKLALQDYSASLSETKEEKDIRETDFGFCVYFEHRYDLHMSQLSVLNEMFLSEYNPWDYWFPEGEIQPRIEKLLIAIEKIEEQLCENSGN